MPELNRANRQVCDVDIRVLKTKAPFLFFDTANTTTAGLTADAVYARAKGARRISFQNKPEGTLQMTAQVYPMKLFALLAGGKIETTAVVAEHKILKAAEAGKITIPSGVETGTLFVYPVGYYGDEAAAIAGSFTGTTFTASTASKIAEGTEYEVGYLVKKESGIKKVAFNSNKVPDDYFITMTTVDKDENGLLTPFIITCYKATVKQNFSMEFSSDADPITITIDFDLMEAADGSIIDMVEDTSENAPEEESPEVGS